MLEPLGLLAGPGARLAIDAGLARPLCGGPLAFTMVRATGGHALPVRQSRRTLEALTEPCPPWADLPPEPLVMGVINVTPDSIRDNHLNFDPVAAIAAGRRMLADGAAILDVGGESTRPGAEPVPPGEEQRRVLPVIAALAGAGAVVSVDTRNAATMEAALDAGAAIVNDVSALRHDPRAAAVIAARRCPVILMHMRGDPRTMRSNAIYSDIAAEVVAELAARVGEAEAAGIHRSRIAVDPGFGFAKTRAQSRELLQRLSSLVNLRCRIIAGLSRKGFVEVLAGSDAVQGQWPGSLAAGLAALSQGATMLRVHDVAATVQAVRVWQALNGWDAGLPVERVK